MTYAWVDCGNGRSVFRNVDEPARGPASSLPRPMIISDTMDPIQCMADGKTYTSKRAMSATHKAHGMIEVGNEKTPPRAKEKFDRSKLKTDFEKAKARFNRGERADL